MTKYLEIIKLSRLYKLHRLDYFSDFNYYYYIYYNFDWIKDGQLYNYNFLTKFLLFTSLKTEDTSDQVSKYYVTIKNSNAFYLSVFLFIIGRHTLSMCMTKRYRHNIQTVKHFVDCMT